jgi:hypothetical protein
MDLFHFENDWHKLKSQIEEIPCFIDYLVVVLTIS